MEARRGQVSKQLLELPERTGGLERLSGGFHGVVGPSFLDENIGAPEIPSGVTVIGIAATR